METFVVRIWSPADAREREQEAAAVRGRLEHVTSGRRVVFHGIEELGTLIVHELTKAGDGTTAPRDREG